MLATLLQCSILKVEWSFDVFAYTNTLYGEIDICS